MAGIRERGGKADFVAADLDGSPAASHGLAAAASDMLGGRIDVLVNNAGMYSPAVSLAETDSETFDRFYAVNVKASYFLTQAVAPHMVADGGGVIINLGCGPRGWLCPSAGCTPRPRVRSRRSPAPGPRSSARRVCGSTRCRRGSSARRTWTRRVDFAGGVTLGTPAAPGTRTPSALRRSTWPRTTRSSSTGRC